MSTIVPAALSVTRWSRVSESGCEPNTSFPITEVDPDPEHVALCRRWLQLFGAKTTGFTPWTSYGCAKDVWRWSRGLPEGEQHPTTGAFHLAALADGYRSRRQFAGSPSATFNLNIRREAP